MSSKATTEQQAAWRVQLGVHHVLRGVAIGFVETWISEDTAVLGDVDHAEMALTEATPMLIAAHASLLERVRAGLRAARAQRRRTAWDLLTPCLDTLATLSGGVVPEALTTTTTPYPPNIRFRVVTAPEPLTSRLIDGPVVFVAGGITACPDWQATVTVALEHDHVVLLNPRRAEFDLDDPDATEKQVRWEYEHRWHESLSYMLFWFPGSSSTQPIAMLELGEALARRELPIFVGADPEFPRYRDVLLQCRVARPDLTVHTDLGGVIGALQNDLRWRP